MSRVSVKPELIRWARERCGLTTDALTKRFPAFLEWESGKRQPTLRQLEDYAKLTLTPFGYFFLPAVPDESLPIPDLRTVGSQPVQRPSAQLLETLYACQRRQDWYRETIIDEGAAPLSFVGRYKPTDPVEEVAESIRQTVKLDSAVRSGPGDPETVLRSMFEQVEEAGVLVMRNGVVGNNTRQPLSVDEFRGFALCDEYAPLIFINAVDTKAAQMFTLAHELAHIWIGSTGISNLVNTYVEQVPPLETFCNKVAAEVLVPARDLQRLRGADLNAEDFRRLARQFRVSTLVIIRRAFDSKLVDKHDFEAAYQAEWERLTGSTGAGGGDFYKTQTSRLGKRFPTALVYSTLEGKTLYRDAFRLLGISKPETFDQLAKELRVSL